MPQVGDLAATSAAKREEVTDGIAQGRGGREVVQRMQDRAKGGYAQQRLESLVRTETMRAYRAQNDADFEALDIELGGWVWSASKSRRTYLACLKMDGTFVPAGEERRAGFHVNCRCRWLSVPAEGMELFLAERESGEEWLRRQDEETLQAMMPNGEARAAFRRGELRLADFTGEHDHPVWGTSVYQDSGKNALARMAAAEKHPANPTVRRAANGYWEGDQLAVMPWEDPGARAVVTPAMAETMNLRSGVLRWAKEKRETVLREHPRGYAAVLEIDTLLANPIKSGRDPRPGREEWLVFAWHDDRMYRVVVGKDDSGSTNIITMYGSAKSIHIRQWEREMAAMEEE